MSILSHLYLSRPPYLPISIHLSLPSSHNPFPCLYPSPFHITSLHTSLPNSLTPLSIHPSLPHSIPPSYPLSHHPSLCTSIIHYLLMKNFPSLPPYENPIFPDSPHTTFPAYLTPPSSSRTSLHKSIH